MARDFSPSARRRGHAQHKTSEAKHSRHTAERDAAQGFGSDQANFDRSYRRRSETQSRNPVERSPSPTKMTLVSESRSRIHSSPEIRKPSSSSSHKHHHTERQGSQSSSPEARKHRRHRKQPENSTSDIKDHERSHEQRAPRGSLPSIASGSDTQNISSVRRQPFRSERGEAKSNDEKSSMRPIHYSTRSVSSGLDFLFLAKSGPSKRKPPAVRAQSSQGHREAERLPLAR